MTLLKELADEMARRDALALCPPPEPALVRGAWWVHRTVDVVRFRLGAAWDALRGDL